MDFGQVVQKMDVDTQKLQTNNVYPDGSTDFFNVGAEKMHVSYGAGLRIAMNENFIIRVDYGIAADKRDGDSGLYIGLNYLF